MRPVAAWAEAVEDGDPQRRHEVGIRRAPGGSLGQVEPEIGAQAAGALEGGRDRRRARHRWPVPAAAGGQLRPFEDGA